MDFGDFGGVCAVGVEVSWVFGERISCQSYTWLLTEFPIWRGVKLDVSDGQG
jgi:hypothetical protein